MGLSLIGLLLLILCVVHIFRSGADRYWIFIVLFLPGIGPVVYFCVEILPGLFRGRAATGFARSAGAALDPGGGVRQRRRALEIADTPENRRLLAEEYLALGRFADAFELYESVLSGIHADDPVLVMGYVRAALALGRAEPALAALEQLKRSNPRFETPERQLYWARCLESVGRTEEALAEYQILVPQAPGEEARCRYALLLKAAGETAAAQSLFAEILAHARNAPGHYRRSEREWIEIARREAA
jgi:hypothetical protein